MNRLAKKNYYERLGVPRDAPKSVIVKAYRELAAFYHPDLLDEHVGDNKYLKEQYLEIFRLITEAYNTLSNISKRIAYDKTLPGDYEKWEKPKTKDRQIYGNPELKPDSERSGGNLKGGIDIRNLQSASSLPHGMPFPFSGESPQWKLTWSQRIFSFRDRIPEIPWDWRFTLLIGTFVIILLLIMFRACS